MFILNTIFTKNKIGGFWKCKIFQIDNGDVIDITKLIYNENDNNRYNRRYNLSYKKNYIILLKDDNEVDLNLDTDQY